MQVAARRLRGRSGPTWPEGSPARDATDDAAGYGTADHRAVEYTEAPEGSAGRDLHGSQRELLLALLGTHFGRVPDGDSPLASYDDSALETSTSHGPAPPSGATPRATSASTCWPGTGFCTTGLQGCAPGRGWHGVTVSSDLPLLGFGLPVSGSWATPSTMVRIARRAEDRGYASLWTFQRLLCPAEGGLDSSLDPAHNPGARPADDPSYRAVLDPLLPLAYVAGHTGSIRLGTATICAPFTAPALLAKSLTTLDHLSAGRLTVGLGIGWLPHEYAAAGVPFARRGPRMEEYLQCLHALWTQDPVAFDGEFYTVPPSHTGPRPVQVPHPPVLLGGAAPAALRRAGRLAQGWISSSRQDLGRIADSVKVVRAGAREVGRDPDQVRILVRALVDVAERAAGPGRRLLHGTRDQVFHDLAALRAQGVTEVLIDLNFSARVGSPDVDADEATVEAERVLDALAPHPPDLRRPAPSA